MHRGDWGRKAGQERVLSVRIPREGWHEALSRAVLTTAGPLTVSGAAVHVQWDPGPSLRGAPLNHYSIQVGIGRGSRPPGRVAAGGPETGGQGCGARA